LIFLSPGQPVFIGKNLNKEKIEPKLKSHLASNATAQPSPIEKAVILSAAEALRSGVERISNYFPTSGTSPGKA